MLDSYASSGTTGHAVLKLNNEDNGNGKFILIQVDEYDKKGIYLKTILLFKKIPRDIKRF